MKIRANRANIKKHAQALLGNNYSPEKEKELILACLAPVIREPGEHVSFARVRHLERVDKVLGNYGVEGMLLDRHGNDLSCTCSERGVYLDCHYSNTGDTYALTVMWVNGKLYIGDWGSLVERLI